MSGLLYSIAGLAGFLFLSYATIRWAFPLLAPFLIGALLAEALTPVMRALTHGRGRWRLPRGLAAALILLTVATVLGLVSAILVSRLVSELRGISAGLPEYYQTLRTLILNQAYRLSAFSQTLPIFMQEHLQELLSRGQQLLQSALPAALGALQAFTGLPGLIADLLVMWVAAFFLLRDRDTIGRFLLGLFPGHMQAGVRTVKGSVWSAAMGVARAQVILMSVTAVLSITGLVLIGSDYAVSAGLLIGVADILPLLGPGAVYLPWALYLLATGQHLFAAKLLVLYGAVAAVRQVLEPKLMGDAMGLHPLTILLSLYLGFTFFGALGLVVGPLLATLLKALVTSGLLPIFRGDQSSSTGPGGPSARP